MKNLLIFSLLLLVNINLLPQNYFPAQTGYKWYYKNTSLDSINNPTTNLIYYQIDSFAVVDSFQGKLSNIILSKVGPANVLADLPYMDTSYVSVEGNKASIYNNVLIPDTLLFLIDSSVIGLAKKFEQWYGVFNFNATINQNVTVYTFDTTITIDTITLPLRFDLRSKRLSDRNVTTEAGTYPCKSFFVSRRLNYLLGIPPFVLPITIVEFTDSVFISENRWIVQQISPTTKIDLSLLNFGTYSVPGNLMELVPEIVNVKDEEIVVNYFYLGQNYPNPFNPNTNIDFSIPENAYTKLIIYNAQGEEVATLLSTYLQKGKYQISFGKNNLSSGVYFYRLTSGNFSISRKMILLK